MLMSIKVRQPSFGENQKFAEGDLLMKFYRNCLGLGKLDHRASLLEEGRRKDGGFAAVFPSSLPF
jgi:hypothetical protein